MGQLYPTKLWTVHDVSNYLGCHPSTVYRMLKSHLIPAARVGSDWRFEPAKIQQWIMEGGERHTKKEKEIA